MPRLKTDYKGYTWESSKSLICPLEKWIFIFPHSNVFLT